jgi:hypothetical protein
MNEHVGRLRTPEVEAQDRALERVLFNVDEVAKATGLGEGDLRKKPSPINPKRSRRIEGRVHDVLRGTCSKSV